MERPRQSGLIQTTHDQADDDETFLNAPFPLL
jgi:hypothetical protein